MTLPKQGFFVFIGTQGQGSDQGLHVAHFDEASGTLSMVTLAAVAERPTWVLADPVRPLLFAVSEVGNAGDRIGELLAFGIDPGTGTLVPLGRVPSGGGGPTHLALAPDGDTLFVANFGGGQAAVVPIAPDGGLQPVSSILTGVGSGPHRRQAGPHAHGVTLDPSGQWLLVPDMGADRIFVYAYQAATREILDTGDRHVPVPAGAGPRLVLFGKDGRFAYLLTELSAEIFVFSWDAEQARLEQTSSIALDPPGFEGSRSAAGFSMSADGRFLYATNRTTHAIHVFALDEQDGALLPVQTIPAGGEKPWAVELTPSGRWLLVANQASNTICLFARDPSSGQLNAVSGAWSCPSPTSLAFTSA